MQVFVNHEPIQLPKNPSLQAVLEQLNITESRGIALAVNNEVVPRKLWVNHLLHDQDRITLIRASQGG